ncbi:guanine nucleotide binding protein 1 [Pelomyxa schiedti]|nr:guanine nucleotide binding protein 1 [Pelomyxa schiedti]
MPRKKPFSGKQKKEYMKTKREKKRAAGEDDSDDTTQGEPQQQQQESTPSPDDPSATATASASAAPPVVHRPAPRGEIPRTRGGAATGRGRKHGASVPAPTTSAASASAYVSGGASGDGDAILISTASAKTTANATTTTTAASSATAARRDRTVTATVVTQPARGSGGTTRRVVNIRRENPKLFEYETRTDVEQAKIDAANIPLDLSKRVNGPIISEEFSMEPLPFPKRPDWSYETTKIELENAELSVYNDWINSLLRFPLKSLNYFECNLETWRQLWRVCERSHLIMMVTDARYPLFLFSSALYKFITEELRKPLILVFNKIDISEPGTVELWCQWFATHYPLLKIVKFSAFKGFSGELLNYDVSQKRVQKSLNMKGTRYSTSTGREAVLQLIRDTVAASSTSTGPLKQICVGSVGNPNVGKSSMINALMGRKVVSVSRTPGHTKHFQTQKLASDIILCDCPGMVFPALDRPKNLQVICGLYPLAHLREPYSALRYIAEHIPLEKCYGLTHHLPASPDKWTPISMAAAYAKKLGYTNKRGSTPDTHRAAIEILTHCIDGKLLISWGPPGTDQQEYTVANPNSILHPTAEAHTSPSSDVDSDENPLDEEEEEADPDAVTDSEAEEDASESADNSESDPDTAEKPSENQDPNEEAHESS